MPNNTPTTPAAPTSHDYVNLVDGDQGALRRESFTVRAGFFAVLVGICLGQMLVVFSLPFALERAALTIPVEVTVAPMPDLPMCMAAP